MISIIVPTYNRPQFLRRLLLYCEDLNFPYTIVVADSSHSAILDQNKGAIDSLRANLSIEYRQYETHIGVVNKLIDSLKCVSTPYTAIGADDDFFVPSTLECAVQFLNAHPDYTVVHGEAVTFQLKSSRVYGSLKQVHRYKQSTIDHPSGAKRLLDHLSHYSTTWYSVQHTEQLRENLWKTEESQTDLCFGEFLPSCLSLIQGKAKKLDELCMVRQIHSAKEYTVSDSFDWVTSPSWASQYERFRDCLAGELARQDNTSLSGAQALVKQAFWAYLAKQLNYPQSNSYNRNRLRQVVRAIPGARRAWRALRSLNSGEEGEEDKNLLPVLLRPCSPYHADFMPIYRAITGGKGAD